MRALGNRMMYGISKVSTVTPHALVSAALLVPPPARHDPPRADGSHHHPAPHRRGGEAPLSKTLVNSPSNPEAMGPIQDAMRTFCSDGMVRTQKARGDVIYQAEDNRRAELSFYKNTLMNLVAARSLVANALLAGAPASFDEVKARALWLSRLFKLEFIYRVGASFDTIFAEVVERLVRMGLVLHQGDTLSVAPEPHARPELEFLADLLRDYLESYLIAALTLQEVATGAAMDRKSFVKQALELGRAEYLSGRITAAESLAKVTLENAVTYMLDQRYLVEEDKKLKLGPAAPDVAASKQFAEEISRYLRHQ